MISKKLHILFILFLLSVSNLVLAQEQEVKIELGKNTILPNENFTIKIIIKNSSQWEVEQLPEIEGFKMGGKSVAHTQFNDKGQKGFIHTISQNYIPLRAGTFKLPTTTVKVNNKFIELKSETISVLQDDGTNIQPIENIKEDALLLLSVNKKEVFVGEGYIVSLAFYVSGANTAEMKFSNDIDLQVDEIAKKIKPKDCLESRLEIKDLTPSETLINNKKYFKYTLFESVYYPLNTKPIVIQPVNVKMIVVLPSKKNPNEKTETAKIFTTNSTKIHVKNLPDHPLKDKVSVGSFYLEEVVDSKKISTGKSFNYTFKIIGEGNLNTVSLAGLTNDKHFDFYVPEIKDNIVSGRVSGERSFKYRIIPKDSGEYKLENYFFWVYFNTKKANYDTLKSNFKIKVSGQSIEDNTTELGNIYKNIDQIDSSETEVDYRELVKNIANILIISMLAGSVFIFRIKKRKDF